jgi:hypothetical protein
VQHQRCSNRTDLRRTLADLLSGSDLPERPSPTCTDLVCIQKARGSSPPSSTAFFEYLHDSYSRRLQQYHATGAAKSRVRAAQP